MKPKSPTAKATSPSQNPSSSFRTLDQNALTKNLDDPILEAMPVHPTDTIPEPPTKASASMPLGAPHLAPETSLGPRQPSPATFTLTSYTPTHTPSQAAPTAAPPKISSFAPSPTASNSLNPTSISKTETISLASARNALLPTLDLIGFFGGSGIAGSVTPGSTVISSAPTGFGGSLANTFNNSAPNYYVGASLNIPIRNRIAKSDQVRSELESRQAELHLQQQRKQIRIEVRNAQYALDQAAAPRNRRAESP